MSRLFLLIFLVSGLFITSAFAQSSTDQTLNEFEDHITKQLESRTKEAQKPEIEKIKLYFGPQIGSVSYTLSSGEKERQSQMGYGFEAMARKGSWLGGFNILAYNIPSETGSALKITQDQLWYGAQVKYIVYKSILNPYVSLGGGILRKTINTSYLSVSEQATESLFIQDLGLGLYAEITKHLALQSQFRYYQYSNINGWALMFSVGYVLPTNW